MTTPRTLFPPPATSNFERRFTRRGWGQPLANGASHRSLSDCRSSEITIWMCISGIESVFLPIYNWEYSIFSTGVVGYKRLISTSSIGCTREMTNLSTEIVEDLKQRQYGNIFDGNQWVLRVFSSTLCYAPSFLVEKNIWRQSWGVKTPRVPETFPQSNPLSLVLGCLVSPSELSKNLRKTIAAWHDLLAILVAHWFFGIFLGFGT